MDETKQLEFRKLEAPEIECKAEVIKNKIVISLHTKAVTCTRILNETVGPMNWEKEYTNGNKNCIVRIWDEEKRMMVSKEDCGGPLTDVDGHKGQASNGFKRVCSLGWGIGIELYTQPEIKFPINDDNTIYDDKHGIIISEKYAVKEIEYNDNREIARCVIVDSKGNVVYDGPNEKGESNVEYPVDTEEELIIPENADMENSDYEENEHDEDESDEQGEHVEEAIAGGKEDILIDLPDNTDGFSDSDDDFMTQEAPFSAIDYEQEFEREIKRTHTKKDDVLRVLGVASFTEVNRVDETLLEGTLEKLKARPTYIVK